MAGTGSRRNDRGDDNRPRHGIKEKRRHKLSSGDGDGTVNATDNKGADDGRRDDADTRFGRAQDDQSEIGEDNAKSRSSLSRDDRRSESTGSSESEETNDDRRRKRKRRRRSKEDDRARYSRDRKTKKDKKKKKKKKKRKSSRHKNNQSETDSESDSDSDSYHRSSRRHSRHHRKRRKRRQVEADDGGESDSSANHDSRRHRKRQQQQDADCSDADGVKQSLEVSQKKSSTLPETEDRSSQLGIDGSNEQGQARPSRAMVPMTREEYERQQSQIREVYDPLSGRTRLVRGNGEIIERIVSRQTHQQINQQATRGDGSVFARSVFLQATANSFGNSTIGRGR